MATKSDNTRVVTGKVRLSYVHVFEPNAVDPDDEPRYSCTLLIPKSDRRTMDALRRAQQSALEAGKDTRFGGKIPGSWADTIHDGDEEADLERNPEYAGHYYMSVSAKKRPGVVDRNVQPILDSTEVYSGCYARVEVGAFAYNSKGKKGVSFGLNNVQKVADGDSFGGRSRPEDVFDAIDDEGGDLL
jgi:hypothetical protein